MILELQGDLEVRGSDGVMENQFIGDLNYDKYGQPVNIFSISILKALINYYILFKFNSLVLCVFLTIADFDHWSPYFAWQRAKNGKAVCSS